MGLVKDQSKSPRLLGRRRLGRGIPPSQPIPPHLAPPNPASTAGNNAPKAVIASAIALGVITVIGAVILSWGTLFAPAPIKADYSLAEFGKPNTSAEPIDLALAIGDDLRTTTDDVSVERVWIDTCQRPGPGRTPPDKCDRQPFFEQALVKAIITNGGCTPERPKDETLSYALEVHYRQETMRLFVGRSGSLGGKMAKSAVKCVERFLPKPDWKSLDHDHTRYIIGALAAYPAQKRQ